METTGRIPYQVLSGRHSKNGQKEIIIDCRVDIDHQYIGVFVTQPDFFVH
jgi:hypothetical protein